MTDRKLPDHCPIVSLTQFALTFVNALGRRRVPKYNSALIGIPENDSEFIDSISNFPGVPYSLDPSSHRALLNNCILQSM